MPENVQQLAVSDSPGIIVHLNRLGVIAHIVIVRIRMAAAGVAHAGSDDTIDNPEPGFDAPESPQSKGCRLENIRRVLIDVRN